MVYEGSGQGHVYSQAIVQYELTYMLMLMYWAIGRIYSNGKSTKKKYNILDHVKGIVGPFELGPRVVSFDPS
jgi:hypothetical protein